MRNKVVRPRKVKVNSVSKMLAELFSVNELTAKNIYISKGYNLADAKMALSVKSFQLK
jgi:hypothetical protein